jgi:hypothetical protein
MNPTFFEEINDSNSFFIPKVKMLFHYESTNNHFSVLVLSIGYSSKGPLIGLIALRDVYKRVGKI